MIKALVFDFDGLILDTEVPDLMAWQEVYAEFGQELLLDTWMADVGRGAHDLGWNPYDDLEKRLGAPLDRESVRLRKRTRYYNLVAAQSVLPGIESLIAGASHRGIRLAVASSAVREWVVPHLSRLGLRDCFETVLTADDVARAKPHPDLYLAAIQALNVEPWEAIALEDSANGVTAAKAAGLFCVAIPNGVTRQTRLDHADLCLPSLEGVGIDDLVEQLQLGSRVAT